MELTYPCHKLIFLVSYKLNLYAYRHFMKEE